MPAHAPHVTANATATATAANATGEGMRAVSMARAPVVYGKRCRTRANYSGAAVTRRPGVAVVDDSARICSHHLDTTTAPSCLTHCDAPRSSYRLVGQGLCRPRPFPAAGLRQPRSFPAVERRHDGGTSQTSQDPAARRNGRTSGLRHAGKTPLPAGKTALLTFGNSGSTVPTVPTP